MNKWKKEMQPPTLASKTATYALYGGSAVGIVTALVFFPIPSLVVCGLVGVGYGVKRYREDASDKSEREHVLPVYNEECWDANDDSEFTIEDL